VAQLAYSIHTTWLVPESEVSWKPVPGTVPVRAFLYDFMVRPDETCDNGANSYEANFAHAAPQDGAQLASTRGVLCQIDWLLILDNAGRKWEVKPSRGGRAKRLVWYRRPREYQPSEFFPTLGQR
jgi:hypothetical protein